MSVGVEQAFWESRWSEQKVGFHQSEYNKYLVDYLAAMSPAASPQKALVPLCGKTSDLLCLCEAGFDVVGVEWVEQAVREFFSETGIAHTSDVTEAGSWFRSTHAGRQLSVLAGDFFACSQTADFVFDRASMIALPEERRRDYAAHLQNLLNPGGRILLVTLCYPQHEMAGPPFSVSAEEVRTQFSDRCEIKDLSRHKDLSRFPKGQAAKLSAFEERAQLVTLREQI